ncbi:hypothetical protein C8Q80DRAFT_1269720 [Daedaleopsis nitida]|nr:hypothetical protein C8Q80DRAFT_1269720 [Daedaleopsis nitida]
MSLPKFPTYLSYYRGKFSSYVAAQNVDQPVRMPQELKTSWALYEAFGVVEDKKIRARRDQLIAKMKAAPGASKEDIDKQVIGAFNMAHSQLWKELSEEDQQAYQLIADAWVTKGPEEEDRLKIASGQLAGWGRGIVDVAWKQGGAVALFIYCYKDAQGSIQVENQLPGMKGQKFTKAQPQWEQNTVKCLARFAKSWLIPDEHAGASEGKSSALQEFAHYKDGIPILPQDKDGKPITDWREMRDILWPWFNQNYALASGVVNAIVPWTKVMARAAEFFPEGLFSETSLSFLKQPGQMDKATVTGLWSVIQAIQS